jgi:hypothetical protein
MLLFASAVRISGFSSKTSICEPFEPKIIEPCAGSAHKSRRAAKADSFFLDNTVLNLHPKKVKQHCSESASEKKSGLMMLSKA